MIIPSFLEYGSVIFGPGVLTKIMVDLRRRGLPHGVGDMGVGIQRGLCGDVTDDGGEGFHIHSTFQRSRHEKVPQIVEPYPPAPGVLQDRLEPFPAGRRVKRRVILGRGGEHPAGVHPLPVFPQHLHQRRRQYDSTESRFGFGCGYHQFARYFIMTSLTNCGYGGRWTMKQILMLSCALGTREHKYLDELLTLLKPFPIGTVYADNNYAYEDRLSTDILVSGKKNTQKIERDHLTLRTHIKRLARKTICFFKRSHSMVEREIELNCKSLLLQYRKFLLFSLMLLKPAGSCDIITGKRAHKSEQGGHDHEKICILIFGCLHGFRPVCPRIRR